MRDPPLAIARRAAGLRMSRGSLFAGLGPDGGDGPAAPRWRRRFRSLPRLHDYDTPNMPKRPGPFGPPRVASDFSRRIPDGGQACRRSPTPLLDFEPWAPAQSAAPIEGGFAPHAARQDERPSSRFVDPS